jgi:hypothetical protein
MVKGKTSKLWLLVRAVAGCMCLLLLLGTNQCPVDDQVLGPDFAVIWARSIYGYPYPLDPYDPLTRDKTPSPTVPFYPFLHRETNCSLTSYATDAQFNVLSTYPNYQDYIHQLASLTTTPDVFAKGCAPVTTGIASQHGVFLGATTTGNFAGATLSADGVQVYVISPSGKVVSGPTDYPTIGTPGPNNLAGSIGIATADLNGDGIADMVVASSPFTAPNVGTLTIFLGKGDGTFQTPVTINLAISVGGVTIDDVNGDGKLDLVAISPQTTGTGINVLLGDGNGNFGTPIAGPATANGFVAVTGDFNGDGKKDIATSTGQILLGNGDGTFTLQPNPVYAPGFGSGAYAGGVAVGDFNNDGKLDLAFTNQSAVTVDIYLGQGNGTFAYAHSYLSTYGAYSVTATDLDGDGNQDLFVGTDTGSLFAADGSSNGIFQSILGRGDGSFVGADAYIPLGPQAQGTFYFDVADFNGDKKPDMVTIDIDSTNGPYLSLLTGNGDGTFNTLAPIPLTNDFSLVTGITGFLAADVNGDGNPDVVFSRTNNAQQSFISVLIGAGHGSFATQVDYPLTAPVVSLVSLDLNGDNKPDLAFITNPGSSYPPTATALYVMLNNGDGSFAAPVQIDQEEYLSYLAAGDVNGDGSPDLVATATGVVANGVAGATYLYISNGNGSLKPPQTLNGGTYPGGVAIADMNNDGKLDVIVSGTTNISSGYVNVLLNKGGGTFAAPQTAATTDSFPASVAVGDINQDGKPDVVLSGCCGLAYSYAMLGNGDGTFSTSNSSNIPALSTTQVKLVDVNNDGVPDLLTDSNAIALEVFIDTIKSQVTTTATSTALVASAQTISLGQAITLTATVTPQSGTGIPTGTVTFFDGTMALGTGTLNGSGVAALSTSSLVQGAQSVTANYGGDSNFSASASPAISVQVGSAAPSYTVSASPSALSVKAGQTGTSSITTTPAGGFNQTVSFACNGLPANSTCSFSPLTVTPNGSAASTTLTFSTNVSATATNQAPPAKGRGSGTEGVALASAALGACALLSGRKRRTRCLNTLRVAGTVMVVAGCMLGLPACGGGGSSQSGPTGSGPTGPVTPAGTYNATVSATAGSLTQTVPLTLTVE